MQAFFFSISISITFFYLLSINFFSHFIFSLYISLYFLQHLSISLYEQLSQYLSPLLLSPATSPCTRSTLGAASCRATRYMSPRRTSSCRAWPASRSLSADRCSDLRLALLVSLSDATHILPSILHGEPGRNARLAAACRAVGPLSHPPDLRTLACGCAWAAHVDSPYTRDLLAWRARFHRPWRARCIARIACCSAVFIAT